MFQDFTVTTTPETGPARLALVRRHLDVAGLDGFLVPRADAHQGEYTAPRDERLAWLTGFTGSAGMAVALADTAAIFVDGRYTLQAARQVDSKAFSQQSLPSDKPEDWIGQHAQPGSVIGYDPWLHGRKEIERFEAALAASDITLRPVDNAVDAVWSDQPAPPMGKVSVHPTELAGKEHRQKRAEVAETLASDGVIAQVLTLPDSICWLLNIRGDDIPRMPYLHGFAILHADGLVDLFAHPAKFDETVRAHLGNDVTIHDPAAFEAALAALDGPIGLDPASAPIRLAQILETSGTQICWQRDPCILPKACKSDAELAGTRTAHLRDGAAMVAFLAWLDQTGPGGTLTEIDVVRELEARRRATNHLQDISFETICGAGPDGAIVHYRVTEDTNRAVAAGDLLLVDSGGQYQDGTTDITRTVAIGATRQDAIRPFTLVLKGMIAISRARWPSGLAGRDLDALARQALWVAGMDYDHGTGHGVGSYLGVHEGPQNLSRRGAEPLKPGMILSNEPGYYREGAFGIRIENLVAVTAETVPDGGDRPMLGFETLTFVPIDKRLIDANLLTPDERHWLDTYHADVRHRIAPLVEGDAKDWLTAATAPL